ncbi:hypothetical protein C8R43DRAFT_311567 [Mycena crocata]|nr:hypothetical protein C8R43DRAFT_311567 [Mycena crocata]
MQTAKEKGNAAFKAGDYPTAIGHYSAAIHADRTDATFPLNRAAAYLKLGKNEDAERDCSTALTLSKGNVKGLFRRAQARVGLGKLLEAQKDLNEAAKLEPANQSVKQELTKIAELLASSAKKSKAAPVDVSATKPAPKRRRVPISIVEADGRRTTPAPGAPAASSKPKAPSTPAVKTKSTTEPTDLMNPVSSRPLNASASTSPVPPQPAPEAKPKPTSFKDAKSARDSSKPNRVGGGIFRASGESTIFAPREGKAAPTKAKQDDALASKTQAPAPAAKQPEKPIVPSPPTKQEAQPPAPVPTAASTPPLPAQTKSPMTLFDFTRAWESTPDSSARFTFLSKIPPAALPALFQTSLEPALFVEVVDVLASNIPAADVNTITAYLRAFAGVPRFGTVVRFLSRAEKARVRGVWGALGVGDGEGSAGLPSQLEEVWGAVYR